MRPAVLKAKLTPDGEPLRGLPAALPEGERVLWQGAPDWRALAVRAFHVRLAAGLMLAMGAASGISAAAAHLSNARVAAAIAGPMIAGGALAGVLLFAAWINARVSIYTVTTRRVILRVGLAIPLVVNLPFRELAGVSLAEHPDGVGDVALAASKEARRLNALMLWPHIRPGRWNRPEPTMRCLRDAPRAATVLVGAMRAAAIEGGEVTEVEAPAPEARRARAARRPRVAAPGAAAPAEGA
ncbi:MAG: PH domain-containing protein [Caulobacteraceae bacterium]|nr:PH domain-containing protein [Caulobacter sp.]